MEKVYVKQGENATPLLLESLCDLARELIEVGDYKGADTVAKRAMKLAKDNQYVLIYSHLNSPSIRQLAAEVKATFLVALVDQSEARYDHSLFLFEEAKILAAKNGNDKATIADCLLHLGEIYVKVSMLTQGDWVLTISKSGKYNDAEKNFKEALEMLKDSDNAIRKGELFNFLGLLAKKCSGMPCL